MKEVTPRNYSMKKRSAKARTNEIRIKESFRDLWMEHALPEITLEQVAERAGVTVRTVLRKFDSKEGLITASIQHAANQAMERESVEAGDLEAAVSALMKEYESMGDAVIRTIRLEGELPAAAEILQLGRAKHRKWCAAVFSPYLPQKRNTMREEKLHAFIAATEVYLWKLLRHDLKNSRTATHRIFLELVRGIAENQKTPQP